jgi:uncharacterized protein (TIGR00730 family)
MTETVWTDTMAERKILLREGTCAVVALPGGVGTLDEVVDTLALVHLHRYDGKILLLNHDGFYEPLRVLLQHYVDEKMLPQETMSKVWFLDTPEQVIEKLENQ